MDDRIYMGGLSLLIAAVSAYFRELMIPVVILIAAMICDYITGMARAWVQEKMSSRIGIVGIVKKVGYLFLVAVACCSDFVIQYAAEKTGINMAGIYLFGLLVTVWLILNECISILENLADMGTPVPGFLIKLVRRLKKSAETQGNDAVSGPADDNDEDDEADEDDE